MKPQLSMSSVFLLDRFSLDLFSSQREFFTSISHPNPILRLRSELTTIWLPYISPDIVCIKCISKGRCDGFVIDTTGTKHAVTTTTMENFGSRLDEAPCFIKFGQADSFTGKGILFLVLAKVACKPRIFLGYSFLGPCFSFSFFSASGLGKGLYQALLAIEETCQASDTVKSRLLDRQSTLISACWSG